MYFDTFTFNYVFKIGNCNIGFRTCGYIRGNNERVLEDISYDECLSLCCADPQCKSFDFESILKCFIQYKNREDVGDAFIETECGFDTYTEVVSSLMTRL